MCFNSYKKFLIVITVLRVVSGKIVEIEQEIADKKDDIYWDELDKAFCRVGVIDAAVEWPNGTIYLFSGHYHWEAYLDTGLNSTARLNVAIHDQLDLVSAAFSIEFQKRNYVVIVGRVGSCIYNAKITIFNFFSCSTHLCKIAKISTFST